MPVREVVYSYFVSLYQYVRTTWPISLIYGTGLHPPSEQTHHTIIRILPLLKGARTFKSGQQVFELLNSLPTDEDWLLVTDPESGYDILQIAVLYRHKDVIHALLSHGCDPNRYSCSSPAHLAAYLGDDNILLLLFQMGAKANLKRGMCYPEPHVPISYETRYFGYTESPVYHCRTHNMTPVECAIHRNKLSAALTIIKEEGLTGKGILTPQALLMCSCREGAPDCIRYFVEKFPECINSYIHGDTPLLAAVPWGEECVTILLENGADVHQCSEGIQETALHRLYRQNIDGLFTIYDTTKYLLTTGIEQEVNAYTHLGETPLHMLVSHVSYTGGNYVDHQRRIPRDELQDSYQEQVIDAIQLLLEFNADPHLLNGPGLSSLSRMLHIQLKAVHPEDNCECTKTSQPNMFIKDYQIDYGYLNSALDVLLTFDSDPNFTCSSGHTPIILLLQLLLFDDIRNVCRQPEDVVKSFQTLLSAKSSPNFTCDAKGTTFTVFSAICQRCFSPQSQRHRALRDFRSNPPQSLRSQFADVINNVLRLFLQYGLEPNHQSSKVCQHLRGGHGNGLIEMIKLAGQSSNSHEIELVEMWIRTLLQWGADPDLEPYPAEPIICHCQSSIFLKRLGTQPLAHYIHEMKDKEVMSRNVSAQRILLMLYHSTSSHSLQSSLVASKGVAFLQAGSINLSTCASLVSVLDGSVDFLTLVNAMSEQPRTLKELSRLTIMRALNRKLVANVASLPLPVVVKKYISDFIM